MLHNLSVYLTNKFNNGHELDEEDHEVFVYGWNIILSTGASVLSMMIIGFLAGQIWGTILFLLLSSGIRSYTGGYHANSYLGCYFITMSTYVTALILRLYLFKLDLSILIPVLVVIAVIIVLIRAPQDHPNRPVEGEERVKFTKQSRLIILSVASLVGICYFIWQVPLLGYLWWAALALTCVAVGLLFSNWRGIDSKEAEVQ